MPHLNPLIAKLSPPPVPSVLAWAKAYDGAKGPLIDLSQAVPGYPAHPDMLRWLGEAAASPAYTGYGVIEGEPELRSAYADQVATLYGAPIAADNIHITSGCNQAFICAGRRREARRWPGPDNRPGSERTPARCCGRSPRRWQSGRQARWGLPAGATGL